MTDTILILMSSYQTSHTKLNVNKMIHILELEILEADESFQKVFSSIQLVHESINPLFRNNILVGKHNELDFYYL